jgi:DNA polymerase III subunit delta
MSLVLLTGSDPFLSARAIDDTVKQWQKADSELGVEEISGSASDIRLRLAEAGGEDLFGTRSILVVTETDAIGDALDALLAAADTSPVIAHHRAGRAGQATLKELKRAADTTIDCQPLKKGRALSDFVTAEFKRHKRRITSDALALLIEAVGTDLADLSSAAHQLAADAQTDPIDANVVGQYFRGVAELSGYQVADAVMLGRPAEVLQRLRQAQIAADGARTGPAIVAAVAGSVRQLIALSACPPGMSDAEVARQVGAPPWKVRTLRAQSRRWQPAQLAHAITLLADLDARVKGGLREGEQLDAAQKLHALERDLIALAVD